MCGQNDSPPYEDRPKRPACERRLWLAGRERNCGVEFGVFTWHDSTGREHVACRHHRMELQHRYPPVESWATA